MIPDLRTEAFVKRSLAKGIGNTDTHPGRAAQGMRVLWGAKRLILSQDTQLARGSRRGELDGVAAYSVWESAGYSKLWIDEVRAIPAIYNMWGYATVGPARWGEEDRHKGLDNAIGYVLSGMLEKDVKDGVQGKRGGQELYKALKAMYTASTRARRLLEQFIVEVKAKAQVLRDMGRTIEDSEILDVAQTTEPKLSDAIATLTASPAINVDIIKKEEDTYSPLVSANTARGSRAPRHPDGRQADLTGGWVDDKGYRWCNVNGDDCHRCERAGHIAAFCMYNMPEAIRQEISDRAHLNANMVSSLAVMEAEGEHQHLAQSAFGVYSIPARRSPSPPASRSPSPPPAADDDDTFDFSGAGGSWGGQYRLFT
ncbi:hypothetical protein GGG16DRAFT_106639 [Schizophyllum commune]